MRPVKLPLQPLVKQAIQRAPRERRRWAPTRRGFMIPGAIAGILVVVFGAVFAHVYVPVHAAPQALASNQAPTLPIVTTSDPTLDAGKIADANSYSVMSMAQVGLVSLNNNSLALIAEAITRLPSIANGDISADGLTYS